MKLPISHTKKKYNLWQMAFMLYFFHLLNLSEKHEEISVEHAPDPLLSLLERIKKGEDAALETLYNATVNRVYGLAVKIVSNPELAEEVVGDVFLQVWRKARDFDAQKAVPMAWLLMICRSRALDKLRREKRITKNQYPQQEQSEVEDTNAALPFDDLLHSELSDNIRKALVLLNEQQRNAIILAFYKGMSHQEISDYTGDPLGTVKSNLRRAQVILKQSLSREAICQGVVYG
jgi:RNA polymerase sigma-70 factor (ECF subfamily)